MSSRNVNLVRDIYAAMLRGDLGTAFTYMDENVVWDLTNHTWPGPDRYVGHSGVEEVLREWISGLDDYALEIEEMIDAGDRVVVVQYETAIHKESGTPIDRRTGSIYTIDGRRAVRVEQFIDADAARAAAGLA